MRARPFIAANESPRPFSEVRAERDSLDAEQRRIDQARDDIARLEGEAADAADPAERKRLQCQAEELRGLLDIEFARRRR